MRQFQSNLCFFFLIEREEERTEILLNGESAFGGGMLRHDMMQRNYLIAVKFPGKLSVNPNKRLRKRRTVEHMTVT